MCSQKRNYWKDSGDMPDMDKDEAEHAHCKRCFKVKCQHKSTNSCSLMRCPLLCGAVFHSCKASEHKELCSQETVPCINSLYGCKQSMHRSERGRHLATCPASVVYCTMEWNRWPVFSRERQERVPFAQKNLHARYGQLDVALAMRDQRILNEAMKAPRRMRRSLRNRLTERFPAVPLSNSHSSYVEIGKSVDGAGVTSDEDADLDAPWDLSRDPPGLQRSICKELFKTDAGSLHLDALDAQELERNGSENVVRNTLESSLRRNDCRTAACSSSDQKDMACMSVIQFPGCDMVDFRVSKGSGSGTIYLLPGDINTANAGDSSLVDRPALSPELNDKTSCDFISSADARKPKVMENPLHETEFHSGNQKPLYGLSLGGKTVGTADQSEVERVSDIEKKVTLISALDSKISCDSGSMPLCSFTGTSDKTCSDYERVEPVTVAGDVLEGQASSVRVTCESGFSELSVTERNSNKVAFVENTCVKLEPAVPAHPGTWCVTEGVFSQEQLSKLSALTSFADYAVSDSSSLLQNSSAAAVVSETKACPSADSLEPGSLHSPHWTDKTSSSEESRSLSIQNSGSAVALPGEASVTSDALTDASKTAGANEEQALRRMKECQRMTTNAAESHGFCPELVSLGMNVSSVSSVYHHNAVVFRPSTGGAVTDPGTLVVDLPYEYHNVVESNSVPPPIFPPPLTLQEILALDLNLESITRYQAKPRSMYTFLCAQNFRRDEYPWHFKNVHSEIHGGLNSWIEARCPLACYGCTYSIQRLNPVNGTLIYDSGIDAFGVRPDSWHCKALGELFEAASQTPARPPKEATPEIYTSKDYDSVVNYARRYRAGEEEVLEDECCGQMGFTDVISLEAEGKGKQSTEDHDVFPSCSDVFKQNTFQDSYSCTKVKRDSPLDLDNIVSSAEGAVVNGRGRPLLLSMLPFEVLQYIAHCLDSFSLCNLAMTSHFIREVCRSIVERRGIVVQEWEKKQFEGGFSWQVTYQRWLFSCAFTPVEKWHFESSQSISNHLKVCPFNVKAEPRKLPFQLCCLVISDNDNRNREAEKKLQKMYPDFDPKSTEYANCSSKLPGPKVLDHLYVNEIGKSGFSGYKRTLRSFALLCSDQFRDSPEPKQETESSDQVRQSLEPILKTESSELVGDCLEAKVETKTSEEFEEYLEPKPETTSEQHGESLELISETESAEGDGDCLATKVETKTSELFEDYLEPKPETTSEQHGESLELILETESAEGDGDCLAPKVETKTSELFEDYLESKLEVNVSEHFGDYMEPQLDAKDSEQLGQRCMEQNLEPNT